MEIRDSEIDLVVTGSEENDLVSHEIVLLWSDDSYHLGQDHHVARFSGGGDILWSSDLSPLVHAAGRWVSSLVLDLDGDGTLEVFVNDHGWDALGSGGTGRNIWILDATSGTLKRSLSVGQTFFKSPPMPVIVDGEISVVIGLSHFTDGNAPDLLIYNGSAQSHRLVDVHNETDHTSWNSLAFFPGPSGGTMVMRSGWMIHTFSWDEPAVNATQPGSYWGHNYGPIVCDIDGDGVIEILKPVGGAYIIDGVDIIDSESMQTRARITQYQPGGSVGSRATSIRLTVADVDDDQRSEVIFGYYDDTGTETAYIFLLGGLDDQTEDPTPTEGRVIGWSIILFVVGANIILIAILIRDWRHKGEEAI